MKNKILACLVFLFAISAQAQDLITKCDGEDIKSRVLKVTKSEIIYKKFEDMSGPDFKVLLSDVRMIIYKNGYKKRFISARKNFNSAHARDMYMQGQTDAARNYRKYKAASTGTLVTSLVDPLAGLIPAITCSSIFPQDENLMCPNPELMKDSDYYDGYMVAAKTIKSGRVWNNWLIGLAVNIGIIAILIFSK